MLNMSQLCDHEERGTLVTMSPYCLGANFSALSMEVEPTVMGLILAISSGLIIFTNLLVAAVLLRLLLKKSSQSWCFVLNLALADILVGVAITGLAAEDLSSNKYLLQKLGTATPANNATAHDQGKGRCLLRMGFVMSSCTASVLSLFLISIDRYVAIKMPLHYFKFSRNWKAAGLLLSLWISSFVLGFLPVTVRQLQTNTYNGFCAFFSVIHKFAMIAFVVCFFPVLCVFIYIYLDLLKISFTHQRQIIRDRLAGSRIAWQYERQDPEHQHGQQQQQPQRSCFRHQAKALRSVVVLLVCVLILWCPFFVVCIVHMACEGCHLSKVLENHLWLLGLTNSFINPMVYAFWQREVRLQLAAMFPCLTWKPWATKRVTVGEHSCPHNVPGQPSIISRR